MICGITLAAMRPPGLEGHDRSEMMRLGSPALVARDRELLTSKHWSGELVEELSWQCESVHVLLWAAGRHPHLLPVDRQIDSGVIVGELNVMARDPSGWLASLVRRPDSELDRASAQLDLWLWRIRDAELTPGTLSVGARSSVQAALGSGALDSSDVREGDVVAFGRPFFAVPREQRQRAAEIVTERVRAIRWIGNDFPDWWQPDLDS